jgi:hypothetical protein
MGQSLSDNNQVIFDILRYLDDNLNETLKDIKNITKTCKALEFKINVTSLCGKYLPYYWGFTSRYLYCEKEFTTQIGYFHEINVLCDECNKNCKFFNNSSKFTNHKRFHKLKLKYCQYCNIYTKCIVIHGVAICNTCRICHNKNCSSTKDLIPYFCGPRILECIDCRLSRRLS